MKNLLILSSLLFLFACNNTKKTGSESTFPPVREQYAGENNVQDERILIYNAYQRLSVKDAEGVGDQIAGIARNAGGYILEKSHDQVRLRVPADSLEETLLRTSQLGKVLHQNITGQDVTDQHTDLNLRLDNARQARQRYLQLLEKADAVSDILLIEKELERLQFTIENLQGQLNRLDELITFATITVSIEEKIKPGPLGWVFVGLYKGLKFLFVWD